MQKKINISIPQPCHENWEGMSPTDKGRFCASCQKNVVDFTTASDRQIAAAFLESNTLCGRFKPSQLERDLVIPKEKNKLWVAASAAIITLLTIGNNKIFAQTPVNTEQTESKTDDIKVTIAGIRTITGTVTDSQKYALPSTQVTNKNSGKAVQTDLDGLYTIEAKTGDTIVFTFIGMVTTESVVTDSNVYNANMQDDPAMNMDIVMVGGAMAYRPTFFGRIFKSIGNIFR